mmetsp:Transcript_27065/g.52462  ORF Transcript_27065/g.52462 Transcript_27065/m.52462 type:complete len:337 (+) Transcript_27065:25-1035(+)
MASDDEDDSGLMKLIKRVRSLINRAFRRHPRLIRVMVTFGLYRLFVRATKRYELGSSYAPKWVSHIVGVCLTAAVGAFGVVRGTPDKLMIPIDKTRQYMIVWHPHGAFATIPAAICSWPGAVGWFPVRFHACIADVLFNIPFVREILMIMGAKRVNRENVRFLLHEGHSIGIQPGGIYEQLRTDPMQEVAYFPPNLGFIRQAIEAGTPLLPAYLFGENQIFDISDTSRSVAQLVHKWTGVPILFVRGSFGIPLIPRKTDIHIRIGRPVEVGEKNPSPTDERVRKVFENYKIALLELFDGCKDECLPPEIAKRGLKIIMRDPKGKKIKGAKPRKASL